MTLPDPGNITPFDGFSTTGLPPVIDWSGEAQGDARLVLMGVRFLQSVTQNRIPVVGRNLRAPIVDLGVQWGNSRMNSPRLISTTLASTSARTVGTVTVTRPVHRWYGDP